MGSGPLEVLGEFLLQIGPQAKPFDGVYDRVAEVWASPPAKPPSPPEPTLLPRAFRSAASTSAVFTVEATRTSTLVHVYKGAVSLRNTHGRRQRTVTVRAGFESTVRGAHPPSRPRRANPPAHPFWK
jgi:ferric-dicitrate binding protein FerR (iron transport regulator)